MSKYPHFCRRIAHGRALVMLCSFVLWSFCAATQAQAQYTYDPAHADEQGNHIRYFGSAKDENGTLLPGVSILLDATTLSYVALTDDQGRFRANLPPDLWAIDKVTASCFKTGFEVVRVSKREGVGPRPTVQVDCLLRHTVTRPQ